MSSKLNFIIYAPPYKDDSGGIIVLHKLCHLLNEMGHQAYLWPNQLGVRPTLRKKIKNYLKRPLYITHPDYLTPLADKTVLTEYSIVVYSEVDYGNPLGAKNVVRWLLHKPGFHTGVANFGKNELFFFFSEHFIDQTFNIDPANKMFVLSLNSAYTSGSSHERSGSCYLMRKGKGRTLIHDLSNSIQIDGLNHQKTAEIFRRSKYFYSYDEVTMFSQYAAMCGCISVVIPEHYGSREEYVEKNPTAKNGIAYGIDDIDHAIKTQNKVADYFGELERESRETVARFVVVAQKHFGL